MSFRHDNLTNAHVIERLNASDPKVPWDYEGLSKNPCITWEIVEALFDKPWNWDGLSLVLE